MIVRLLAHVFIAKAQASRARHENHELRRRVGVLEIQCSRIRDERDAARRDAVRLQAERDHERDVVRRARAAANDDVRSTLQPASGAPAGATPAWSYGSPRSL